MMSRYVAYHNEGNGGKLAVIKWDGNSWGELGSPGFSEHWKDQIQHIVPPLVRNIAHTFVMCVTKLFAHF